MFQAFGPYKLSATDRNMGKAGAGRPFGYGLPADTRSLEGGPPFPLIGRR